MPHSCPPPKSKSIQLGNINLFLSLLKNNHAATSVTAVKGKVICNHLSNASFE
jgi:hypothetical protein